MTVNRCACVGLVRFLLFSMALVSMDWSINRSCSSVTRVCFASVKLLSGIVFCESELPCS